MDEEEFERAARYWTDRDGAEPAAERVPEGELRTAIEAFFTGHNTCAMATGAGEFVRCTPLEYQYRDGVFWIFSEGGLKFRALERNVNVCLAIYEPYAGFAKLASAQVMGVAEIVDPADSVFAEAAAAKGIPADRVPKLAQVLRLIKVVPTSIDFLDSSLKK